MKAVLESATTAAGGCDSEVWMAYKTVTMVSTPMHDLLGFIEHVDSLVKTLSSIELSGSESKLDPAPWFWAYLDAASAEPIKQLEAQFSALEMLDAKCAASIQ